MLVPIYDRILLISVCWLSISSCQKTRSLISWLLYSNIILGLLSLLSHLSHSILTGCSQPARSRAFVAALPRPELVPVMTTILRKTENPVGGWWELGGSGKKIPSTVDLCRFWRKQNWKSSSISAISTWFFSGWSNVWIASREMGHLLAPLETIGKCPSQTKWSGGISSVFKVM